MARSLGGGFGLVEAGAAQEGGPEAFLGAGVASDEDVLQDGHVGEEPDVLEGAGDAGRGDLEGLGRQDVALVADLALGGDVEAGEAVEEGGLAGAVGADEADDLAAVDGEVDVAYGGEAAEAHGDAAGFEDGVSPVVVVTVVAPRPWWWSSVVIGQAPALRGTVGRFVRSRGIRAGGGGWR